MTAMRLKRYPSPSGGIALGKMGVGATLLKQGKTARDYVQNGLVAMWDGIENAGWGAHTDNISSGWASLIGGATLNIASTYEFKSNHLDMSAGGDGLTTNISNTSFFTNWCNSVDARELTFEVATQTDTPESGGFNNTVRNNIAPNNLYGFVCVQGTSCLVNTNLGGNGGYWLSAANTFTGTNYVATTFTPSNEEARIDAIMYRNGVALLSKTVPSSATTTPNFSSLKATSWLLGKRVTYQNKPADRIFCCRIYSRALTSDEIAANYKIDKERFNLP